MIGPEIKLNNVSENETVNYRLILIKGSIFKHNALSSKTNGEIECKCNGITTKWPISHGRFKSLAHLVHGENRIKLDFQGLQKEVVVNFVAHNTDNCVVPIYFIPEGHNGCFQASKDSDNSISTALSKIGFGILMIQSLFAEKLKERNHSRKSFQIEADIDTNAPLCREFRSKIPLEKVKVLNEEELWEEIGRELVMSDLGNDNRKFVCFVSCTFWNGESVTADPALGGGGLALLGSASLHSWPSSISQVVSALTDNRKLDAHLLDNSCYRGTYSGVFATSLGSAAHEIGHTFNLGHTRSGLMSRGFDHTHLVFIQSSIEDKEQLEELTPCLLVSNSLSGKNTQHKITISSQPENPQSTDLTFLEPGCAAILAHHKWFNPTPSSSTSISYDKLRHIVTSDGGLRVVEVRGANGAVRRSWILRGSGRHLVIPTGHSGATLVAIDSNGTILTATV